MLNGVSPGLADSLTEFMSNISSYVQSLVNSVSSTFLSFAKTLPNLFVTFIVFCVAVYLFAFSLDTMREKVLSLFDESSQSQVNEVLLSLKNRYSAFAGTADPQFVHVRDHAARLAGIGYQLPACHRPARHDCRHPADPGVGSVLIPWSIYLLAVGDIFTGIGLIFMFILITVIRRVLEPKVIGDAVGIGALPALVSMYVGFKLVGVIGFLSAPWSSLSIPPCVKRACSKSRSNSEGQLDANPFPGIFREEGFCHFGVHFLGERHMLNTKSP